MFCEILILFVIVAPNRCDLIIKDVDRDTDLQSPLVKIRTKLRLQNTGTEKVDSFKHFIHRENVEYFAFLEAKKDGVVLSSEREPLSADFSNTGEIFTLKLPVLLSKDELVTVFLEEVYINKIKAYPVQITQGENQLVRFIDNLHYYAPYDIETENIAIKVGKKAIEDYTKIDGYTNFVSGSSLIRYGPFKNVKKFKYEELKVHYENHAPFLLITSLKRIVEISHWGNIAVEEHIEMIHSGAKLKGSFSRYDYMTSGRGLQHSVRAFTTVLPKGANKIYYRDVNGNISTSHVRSKRNMVEIDLQPRFPLFGGWKTKYILGYNVPSSRYLFQKNGYYTLKFPFVDHIHNSMQIIEAEVSIRFPVGVKNVKVSLPYEAKRLPDGTYYNYMDAIGRKVLNFEKSNVVENHIQNIEIDYERNQLFLFYEPAVFSTYIFIILIIVIMFSYINFSLTNKTCGSAEKVAPVSAAASVSKKNK